jgi:maltose O-acetyltransferase
MIRSRGGSLIIGENSVIGANCDLVARGSTLEIERNHLMGPYCYLSTGRRVFDNKDVPMNTQPIKSKPILIEEDVWLGSRVTVLAGGIVRKGAVIGASSLVNHEIEEYSVACGTPARKMKYR